MADSVSEAVVSLADGVVVSQRREGNRLTVGVGVQGGGECVLHWGLGQAGNAWQEPPGLDAQPPWVILEP